MRTTRFATWLKQTLCLIVLCFAPAPLLAHKDVEPKDQAEALKWTEEALSSFKNVRVDSFYALYSEKEANFGIAFARISKVVLVDTGKYPYRYAVSWQDYAHEAPEHIYFGVRRRKDAERFAAALEYLATGARDQIRAQNEGNWQRFEAQLPAWRAASPKPAMPESAREHQVLAEYAFKEKDTEKAIREYAAALEVFPTWPEGQFNLATLAGEKKYYEMAILHMKEYLELTPDSADSQAARDSIIIWKDKLSSLVAESNGGGQQSGKAGIRNVSGQPKF
jgi:tetratricopeptide (TPR) repeat protein